MTFAVLAVGCLVALPVVVVLKRKADAKDRKDAILRGLERRPAPDQAALPGFWTENLERRKQPRPPLPQLDDDNEPHGV